jgi:RNase P subunit RPR2
MTEEQANKFKSGFCPVCGFPNIYVTNDSLHYDKRHPNAWYECADCGTIIKVTFEIKFIDIKEK